MVSREFVSCPICLWKFQEGCYCVCFKITVLISLSLVVPRPFHSCPLSHANTTTEGVQTVNPLVINFFCSLSFYTGPVILFLALPLQTTTIYVIPSERAIFSYTHVKLQACRYILLCSDHCKTVYLFLSCRVVLRVTIIKTSSEVRSNL